MKHFKNIIKNNDKNKKLNILDIGTGYGLFPHNINKEFPNFNVYFLNINKIKYGIKKLNLNYNIITENIETDDFIKSNKCKFDVICSNNVLEHVYNPILWINNIMKCLKPGGIIILEIPNEDDELIYKVKNYSNIIHFEDHVNYFTKNTLEYLLKKCNIKKYNITGVQRYGFYNYIDWIRYGMKEKVKSDDYININIKPRSYIEELWIKYRVDNLNCDTLKCIIEKE